MEPANAVLFRAIKKENRTSQFSFKMHRPLLVSRMDVLLLYFVKHFCSRVFTCHRLTSRSHASGFPLFPKNNRRFSFCSSSEIGVVIFSNIRLILSYSQAKESALAISISSGLTCEKSTRYPATEARYSTNNRWVLPLPFYP